MKANGLILLAVSCLTLTSTPVLAHGDDDHHGTSTTPGYTAPTAPAGNYGAGHHQRSRYPNFGRYTNYWNQHSNEHAALLRAEREADQLAAQGLITQQEHALLDAQLQADHAAFDGQSLPNGFGYNFQSSPYVNPAVPGILQRLANTWGVRGTGTFGAVPQAGNIGGVRHAVTDAVSGNAPGHVHQTPMYQPGLGTSGAFGAYTTYWNQHPQDHQALQRSEREAHQLLQQGVITPQEHALLDAQWQADHAAYDGRALPTKLGYNFQSPYVNPGVQGVLQKLRSYWGL